MNTQRLFAISSLCALLWAACSAPRQQVQSPVTVMVKETQLQTVVETQVVEESAFAVAATAAPQPTQAPVNDSNVGGGASPLSFAPAGSRLVIKNAEMELLVGDADSAISRVTQMAGDYGGYIISSQTWYVDGFKYASLQLGLPSAEFERALNYLRTLALQVIRENATGQDVSAEYTDLQSRLTNLEATAARVREFLADAKTVEESLRINGQLSELEVQIEQIKGQMRFYEGRAAFSTVTVFITPQYPTPTPSLTPTLTQTPTPTPTLTPTPGWNPGQTFNRASGVLVNAGQTTADALIWFFVVGGPPIAIGLVFLGAIRWMRRKRT